MADSYPVVIVGAGPIGLCSSILLSQRGIRNVVYERHQGTSIHPKACGINQRTTEVFRSLGMDEAIRAIACPDDIKGRTGWYTSLGGDGAVDGKEIWSRDAWGGGSYTAEYETHAPSRYEILPQIRLEPLLVAKAREMGKEKIGSDPLHFNAEVVSLEEGEDSVVVNVRHTSNKGDKGDEDKDDTFQVRARYVIAADGGRGITDQLGVPWDGERDILDMVSVHFRAPLRKYHPDPRNFITWFSHPERGGSMRTGYLYQIGPWPQPADDKLEEWVFACAPTATDPEKFDSAAMVERLRATLKVPEDVPMDVISLSHWQVHAIAASQYRAGPGRRVFLAGDAAHRIPPWGALGMNSGVQDVQNLIWKLALALGPSGGSSDDIKASEKKYDKLLDTYDAERRPVGRRVGQSSLHNLRSHGMVMDAALGMGPDKTTDENKAALMVLLDTTHPGHAAKKELVEKAQKILDLEFKAPGAEVGWFYPQKGEEFEELDTEFYHPSTKPGRNLPHAWLTQGAKKVALRDLLPLDKLLLIANNAQWQSLANDRVDVAVVTGEGGKETWAEPTGTWAKNLDGYDAVLVRPDGIVSWRGNWSDVLSKEWPAIVDNSLCLA